MADSHSERPITIDRNGTVHLGARTIAVPRTVSPEARQYLATPPWVMAVLRRTFRCGSFGRKLGR